MKNKLLKAGLVVLIIGAFAFVFSVFYEIKQDNIYVPPSREAQANEYLALDRWLEAGGIPVRIETRGDLPLISSAEESTILIQTALFNWTDEAADYLESWIENGGSLIICLSYNYRTWTDQNVLGAFLLKLGIEPSDEPDNNRFVSSLPSLAANINIKEPEGKSLLILRDGRDLIRLVQIPYGKGTLTVTGTPRFMTTYSLRREPNAQLSWYLLSEAYNENNFHSSSGVLFIRGYAQTEGLMGRIFERGNFAIIIISAIILIAAGFWSVIPVFGLTRSAEEIPGKSLGERFLAEGRFLKRHNALDFYRETYFREIRRRLAKRNRNEDEFAQEMAASINTKNFLESVVILKNTLERL